MKVLKLSLLLLSVILLSSCATITDPFRQDTTTFTNAIKNNDIKTVKHLLAGKSFKEKSLRSTFVKLFKNSYEYDRSGDANTYIHQAITGSGDAIYNPPICRDEIVEELLKAKLEPFSMHLADAATLPCPKIVRTLIPLLPKRKLDHAVEIIIGRLTKNTYLIENRLLSNLDSWNAVFSMLANSEISSDLITKLNKAKDNLYVKTKNQNNHKNQIKYELAKIQEKYGRFCKTPDLAEALLNPYFSNNEQNCIYVLGQYFKVIQSIDSGTLVAYIGFNEFEPKIIHIKTKQKFIDGQFLQTMYVRPNGNFKYLSAFNTQKIVSSFLYVDLASKEIF